MHLLLMKLNLVNQWKYKSLLPLISFVPLLSAAILLNINYRLKNNIKQNKARISALEITNNNLKKQLGLLASQPSGKEKIAVNYLQTSQSVKPGTSGLKQD